ncbi:class I SAM-dependent methyltransferase [Cellulomonas sp.]|uniref:class I SAM-dependent methyltransferase n=1 Tax=Cellulomonas sp. TaxID=40001 RepID=UPI0025BA951B|nr:class I SAM-dependent methyltransferase [Cellulomonas sp.]
MSFYKTTVDTRVRNSSHTLIVEMVGEGRIVLDVGCASGYLGAALQERGCEVSGVEIDQQDASEARKVLGRVEVVDLETTPLDEVFEPGSFDDVIFGDVLEHLRDPAAALRSAERLLRPGGSVVVSVPNVAHGSVRLALLEGRWEYLDTGLLDRTHVTFFTYDSLMRTLHDAGLRVRELRATVFDALGTEVAVDAQVLPDEVVHWVRQQPYADVYQFVLAAGRADEVDLEPTDVVPAELLPQVEDEHTERALRARVARETADDPGSAAARLLALRHEVLVAKDHAIGQEAQLGVLRHDLAVANEELRKAIADAKHAHAQWAATIAHAQGLQRQIDGGLPARTLAAARSAARDARRVGRRLRRR